MAIQGSLQLFSPLDLLQNLIEKTGSLRLATPSGTLDAWIDSGYLTRLIWQGQDQELALAPLILLERCTAQEGRFDFSPRLRAAGSPLSTSAVRLNSLVWTLCSARVELGDRVDLPGDDGRFIPCKPRSPLSDWEAALFAKLTPWLVRGHSVSELAHGLQLPLEGLRYGLSRLHRAGAIQTLLPVRTLDWMPDGARVA